MRQLPCHLCALQLFAADGASTGHAVPLGTFCFRQFPLAYAFGLVQRCHGCIVVIRVAQGG